MKRPTIVSGPYRCTISSSRAAGCRVPAVRGGRHIRHDQCVYQLGTLQLELGLQLMPEPPLLGLQERAGVVRHEPDDTLVGALLVAKEPRTVERVKAGGRDGGEYPTSCRTPAASSSSASRPRIGLRERARLATPSECAQRRGSGSASIDSESEYAQSVSPMDGKAMTPLGWSEGRAPCVPCRARWRGGHCLPSELGRGVQLSGTFRSARRGSPLTGICRRLGVSPPR